MEPSTSTSSRNSPQRSHIVLGVVVIANAACDLFLSSNLTGRFPRLLAMGVLFSQPLFLGAWAAFGPPPAVKRLPLTLIALVVITIANGLRSSNLHAEYLELLLIEFGIFFASAVVLTIVAKIRRWRISRNDSGGEQALNRFSLRYLVGLTTMVAILLGVGRILVPTSSTPPSSGSLWDLLLRLAVPCGTILLATFPVLSVPLLVLSTRVNYIAAVAAMLIVWTASFLCAIATIVSYSTEPLQQIVIDIAGLQIAGTAVGIAFALGVRFAGYRLTRYPPSPSST